jgi:aspartate aminotransferase-like enzyme
MSDATRTPVPVAEGTDFGRFFLPGPTEVHPDVLAAMNRPMIPHRGKEMVRLLEGMEPQLRKLFRTERPVYIGTCSATAFMEMAVRCGVRHRTLSLVGGAFGERFAALVQATGRDAVRLDVQPGRTVEPDMLRDALSRTEVDAVTLVHSETSTGALAPLEELAAVVHEFDDVLLLVDAVTSMGGTAVETDEWNLDFVLTGSQKALALPPGLALGVASERMIERAKLIPERGGYLDVLAYEAAAADHQPTNTPGIPQLYALEAQLQRIESSGGVEARWRRHAAMQRVVERWIDEAGGELGFSFLPPEGRRSPTVSCLKAPPEHHARDLVQLVKKRGWVLGTGYGGLKSTTLRVGHMGDHTPEAVEQVLHVLASVIE